jgi:hypothetical protein
VVIRSIPVDVHGQAQAGIELSVNAQERSLMSELPLTPKERVALREAIRYLDSPSLLMRFANIAGVPAQKLLELAPAKLTTITDDALRKAMDWSIATLPASSNFNSLENAHKSSRSKALWHRVAATVAGGIGGAFGLPGLAVELPLTTLILFRSIASIANELGEDLSEPHVRLECLTVFSMGGPNPNNDSMDSAYLSSRLTMAGLVREASAFMVGRSPQAIAEALAKGSAPKLLALISKIGAQFNIVVSQKFLAQSVPVVGGVSGAVINNAFAGHFNTVAKHHFTIREMERRYGEASIQQQLKLISDEIKRKEMGIEF